MGLYEDDIESRYGEKQLYGLQLYMYSVECMRGEEWKGSVIFTYFGSNSIYFQFEGR